MRRSLWFRVLGASALSVVLVQAAAGLTTYLLMRARLFAEFDATLAGKVRALAALVEQEGSEIDMEFDEKSLLEFIRSDRPEFLQVWGAEGKVLYRSSSLHSGSLERVGGTLGAPVYRFLALPDGRPGRLAGVTFFPRRTHRALGEPQKVTLVMARETAGVESTLARLRLLLLSVCVGTAFVSVAFLDWVVSRGVRSAGQLASQIAGLGDAGLSARVRLVDAPTELVPIVERLNALLAQLDAAFEREKSFTANVAHELRTPLTGLLTTLDLALSKQRRPAEYREALNRCHVICRQMGVMVDNLLALVRAEAGQMKVTAEPVDIEQAVQEAWVALGERRAARGLRVEWCLEPDGIVLTDPALLRLILINVLANAVTHADTGGYVRIASSRDEGRAEIAIINSGSKLTPDEARHVFERFWRGDAGRGDTGVHCGLGLPLCKTLMGLLGGRMSISSVAGGEFAVTLSFEKAA